MASNGTGFSDRSAGTFVDDSSDGFSPMPDVARVQHVRPVVGDSEAARVWAVRPRPGRGERSITRGVTRRRRTTVQCHSGALS